MRRAVPILVAAIVILVAGCGRVVVDTGSAATPTPTTSPSATPSPTDWQTFTSPKLGYTINVPSTLPYRGSTQGTYPSDYFSNENVGAPDQMDQSGIFFTVVVTTDSGDQCLQHAMQGATIDREDSLLADGTAATLYVLSARGAPMMILNVLHAGHCYQFDFITWNKQVRDANESTAKVMIASFHFGSGPNSSA